MPQFRCETCATPFDVPQRSLDKFPGWKPRRCRAHRASKGGAVRSSAADVLREENLTLAQVLARYTGGPTSGVFTDGSAHPNPGPGGWGVVWVEAGEIRDQRHGHEPGQTTNNRMELQALIEAFRLLSPDADVVVRTDSRLCVDTVETWAAGWEKKGWSKKGGPIRNLELIQELVALRRSRPACRLEWIASHSGARWNEYADSLSTAWSRDEL